MRRRNAFGTRLRRSSGRGPREGWIFRGLDAAQSACDRRRGVHRLGGVPAPGRRGRLGAQHRRADLCRKPAIAGGDRQCAELPLRQDRHLRPARRRRGVRDLRSRPGDSSRRRKPRRPLDHRPGTRSSRPISSARSPCSRPRAPTGAGSRSLGGRASASCMSRPTRFTARSARRARSSRRRPTIRARPIRPRRRPPIISSRPGRAPTASRR